MKRLGPGADIKTSDSLCPFCTSRANTEARKDDGDVGKGQMDMDDGVGGWQAQGTGGKGGEGRGKRGVSLEKNSKGGMEGGGSEKKKPRGG